MSGKITISGYYGFGNTGDEAVLSGILATLREVGVDAAVTVLSADPERTCREHPGVDAVHRYGPVAVWRAIRGADLVISGGGSLFQDATSARSSYYYLAILRLAQALRRRTMVYAQGVGPLTRPTIRQAVARAFDRANAITVRDDDSRRLLEEIGVTRVQSLVTADPSALMAADYESADAILAERGLAGGEYIAVALRPWPASEGWLAQAAEGIRAASGQLGVATALVPMQETSDLACCEAIGEGVVLRGLGRPEVVKGVIGRSALVIGMRLHSLIFAAAEATPFVPVVYDPKVSSFAAAAGVGSGVDVSDITAESVSRAVVDAWQRRQDMARDLTLFASRMRDNALESGLIAKRLLQEH